MCSSISGEQFPFRLQSNAPFAMGAMACWGCEGVSALSITLFCGLSALCRATRDVGIVLDDFHHFLLAQI
jgi:hypothetical protein